MTGTVGANEENLPKTVHIDLSEECAVRTEHGVLVVEVLLKDKAERGSIKSHMDPGEITLDGTTSDPKEDNEVYDPIREYFSKGLLRFPRLGHILAFWEHVGFHAWEFSFWCSVDGWWRAREGDS